MPLRNRDEERRAERLAALVENGITVVFGAIVCAVGLFGVAAALAVLAS